jgi:hypothetical protein
MLCPKCDMGGKSKKLCPVSLGLAVGVVGFFCVLIWSLWVMFYGIPPMMETMRVPPATIQAALVHGLLVFVKGFLGGFFVALLYNFFVCCCKACRKCNDKCECPPEKK